MHSHAPVLLEQTLTALAIKPAGTYVDGTFGRGGHSGAILQQLGSEGKLIAIDRDASAVEFGKEKFSTDPRFTIVKSEFSKLDQVLNEVNSGGLVDGVLLDLGVSSPQLDMRQRGFSFSKDGPLDMRMDTEQKMSAQSWLASAELQEIRMVIKNYGEEKFAHRIATAIVEERQKNKLTTTLQLAELIENTVPRKERRIHPATRTFQAIRIHINAELDQLKLTLAQSLSVLKPGARLAVISFHSLEDRIVKRFMRDNSREDIMYSGMAHVPESAKAKLRLVGKQIRAAEDEVALNPRARSAVLRAAERMA